MTLHKSGSRKSAAVHRMVLEAFVGPCPDGMQGCHWNGEPADNRVENLRWDTPRSNMADKLRHGQHAETRKVTCPRGHSLFPPNLTAEEWRKCLACRSAREAQRHARRAGRSFDLASEADRRYSQIMAGRKPCRRGHDRALPGAVVLRADGSRKCRRCLEASGYLRKSDIGGAS